MTTKTAEYEPDLIIPDDGSQPFYRSDDGFGTMIAWSSCHAQSGGCGNSIMACNCKGGPKEPYYITRWRVEAQGGVFVKPGSTRSERPFRTRNAKSETSSFRESRSGPKSLSDFIDADVIATVKAASEASQEERDANS